MDAEQLLESACERTGLDDYGEPGFRDGLDHLVDAMQRESRLNEIGEMAAPETLLMYLTNRLQLRDWHARHPEIGQVEVSPVVFMIGMGRTGTTIVHDLLGQDPRNRTPRTWEVDRPFPPPEAATYDTDPRIAEVQAGIDAGLAARPDIQAMHPTGARLAQECIRFTGMDMKSLIFLSQFAMPSYMRWLTTEADLAPTYRLHREFLQLLQWRNPRERWVLKSGAHLWALPPLLAEYPDAFFVQTHRDPLRVIASLSSLFTVIRSMFSDETTLPAVAEEWADPIVDALDRSVDAREQGLVAPDRVVDVQYKAFMDDPFGTIATVYERMGSELTDDAETRMRAFLAEHARDKHGLHRYTFADTGLDAGRLRERTRRYTEYFDVPEERLS